MGAKRNMPKGYPCTTCQREARQTCSAPCPKFWIYYAKFMRRCRIACNLETPEREEQFRKYVALQRLAMRIGRRTKANEKANEFVKSDDVPGLRAPEC